MNDVAPEYVNARRALLDVLELLEAQRAGLVLVGAQAIYLHAPAEQAHLYTYTLDGDLALDPDLLTESPDIGRVLVDAGYTEGQNPAHTIRRPGSRSISWCRMAHCLHLPGAPQSFADRVLQPQGAPWGSSSP